MEKERVIEILLILILMVLIFIMVLIGLNVNSSQTIITNSYNIDNSQTSTGKTAQIVKEVPTRNSNLESYYDHSQIILLRENQDRYFSRNYFNKYSENYDSWGRHIKKEFSNYYTDEFEVHIINNGFEGKYYKVIFYFEDFYGHEKNYEMRKYVFPDEEKEFYFRDINRNKYAYDDWSYQVIEE